jgi:hypothetical protein
MAGSEGLPWHLGASDRYLQRLVLVAWVVDLKFYRMESPPERHAPLMLALSALVFDNQGVAKVETASRRTAQIEGVDAFPRSRKQSRETQGEGVVSFTNRCGNLAGYAPSLHWEGITEVRFIIVHRLAIVIGQTRNGVFYFYRLVERQMA